MLRYVKGIFSVIYFLLSVSCYKLTTPARMLIAKEVRLPCDPCVDVNQEKTYLIDYITHPTKNGPRLSGDSVTY